MTTTKLRTYLGTGIGLAALATGAALGVHTLGSHGSTAAAATARGFGGAPGGAGGPMGQGGPGGVRGQRPGAFGEIASINGATITLADPMTNANVVVHTTASTTVVGTTTSVSGLKVGDRIGVDGTTASDGSVTATTIHVGGGPGGPRPPAA
jgi:uncharacterized protein DUF5666